MNYGIGGLISPHVDSLFEGIEGSAEAYEFGGPRFITFMVYISHVNSGGRTIFPQLGLSVKPVKGSALYWFNIGPHMNYDSRVLHLGCPVIYGNKWITNKWIKLGAQFKHFPCDDHREHYSIFGHI